MSATRRVAIMAVCLGVVGGSLALTPSAGAYGFEKRLKAGDSGSDVKALQIRIAGWFPADDRTLFVIDGDYGPQTEAAVAAFRKFHGLTPNGKASLKVLSLIEELEDRDGSTSNFDWTEFTQNGNSGCGAQANGYEGTFAGGKVAPSAVKKNVRRLMWRLEALRAKAGHQPVGINSGFRSVAYNDCVGGARASQHLYGTAADNRVAKVDNGKVRDLARASQFEGIGCYSSLTHNHLDLRIENKDLEGTQTWWWPDQDKAGRDLDDSGSPCWGEKKSGASSPASTIARVLRGIPGIGSLIPSADEIRAFEQAGEVIGLGGLD